MQFFFIIFIDDYMFFGNSNESCNSNPYLESSDNKIVASRQGMRLPHRLARYADLHIMQNYDQEDNPMQQYLFDEDFACRYMSILKLWT